jgi:ABC-type nitrate/sulfonate/bicarbonate transport system substrate-binding protein
MGLIKLDVMYGRLEGAGRDFARDPTGYLSIEAAIFKKHGLEVSWNHVQGTEERYRRLEDGSAQISLVVGRASLQHFLKSKATRILGCAMNSCSYFLVARAEIKKLAGFKNKTLACREGPSRNAPIAETFEKLAGLRMGKDISLELPPGDQDAFSLLADGKADGALLPRPFAFIAEERGFRRIAEWPDIVDDPLPITIETTAKLWRERAGDFKTFLAAHGEGIRYFKSRPDDALRILGRRFGHSGSMAEKILNDYIVCMDDSLTVEFKQFERLLAQVVPAASSEARRIASEWIVPGAVAG